MRELLERLDQLEALIDQLEIEEGRQAGFLQKGALALGMMAGGIGLGGGREARAQDLPGGANSNPGAQAQVNKATDDIAAIVSSTLRPVAQLIKLRSEGEQQKTLFAEIGKIGPASTGFIKAIQTKDIRAVARFRKILMDSSSIIANTIKANQDYGFRDNELKTVEAAIDKFQEAVAKGVSLATMSSGAFEPGGAR